MASNHGSALDDGWELDLPEPLPPPPPAPCRTAPSEPSPPVALAPAPPTIAPSPPIDQLVPPVTPSAPITLVPPPIAPTLPVAPILPVAPAPATTPDEIPRGKRRLARGTDPAALLKRHGLRRVVAQPGQFTDPRPLPGVTPLPTPSAVVAAKILATFPANSDAANQARSVIANPSAPAIAPTVPRRRDPTPRSRRVNAALHQFGAVCYIRAKPTRAATTQLPERATDSQRADIPARRPLWKRLFGA